LGPLVGLFTGGDISELDARRWSAGLAGLHERFAHRFARSESRESALAYMRGLLAPLERKNEWTVAEEAGHSGPDRIQRLLNRIDWDADGVLDDVRRSNPRGASRSGGSRPPGRTASCSTSGPRRRGSGSPSRSAARPSARWRT
jgi:hypothetical protein